MSKFCNNCGSEMADDVVFCPNCGAQDAPAYEEAPAANNAPNKKVVILGGIAAAIVAVVALLIILGGGPKRALNRWEKVVNGKGKVEKLIPEDVFKALRDEDEDFSKGDFLDGIEDSFEKSLDGVKDEYGDNAKVKYTIVDKKKMNKEDLEDYAEMLDKAYGISEKSVKAAYRMAVKVTTRGKDGKTFHYEQVIVLKIDGKWYSTDILGYVS